MTVGQNQGQQVPWSKTGLLCHSVCDCVTPVPLVFVTLHKAQGKEPIPTRGALGFRPPGVRQANLAEGQATSEP